MFVFFSPVYLMYMPCRAILFYAMHTIRPSNTNVCVSVRTQNTHTVAATAAAAAATTTILTITYHWFSLP